MKVTIRKLERMGIGSEHEQSIIYLTQQFNLLILNAKIHRLRAAGSKVTTQYLSIRNEQLSYGIWCIQAARKVLKTIQLLVSLQE